MKFIDVKWYCSGHGNVGIIKVDDQYDGIKYYIGQVLGIDEKEDIAHIMALGSSFDLRAGDVLFGTNRELKSELNYSRIGLNNV